MWVDKINADSKERIAVACMGLIGIILTALSLIYVMLFAPRVFAIMALLGSSLLLGAMSILYTFERGKENGKELGIALYQKRLYAREEKELDTFKEGWLHA